MIGRLLCLVFFVVLSAWGRDLYLPAMLSHSIELDREQPEQSWASAALAGGFTTLKGEWAPNSTLVCLGYDQTGLYVQITGQLSPGQVPRNKCSAHDNFGVFSDDSVEIMLSPARVLVDGQLQANKQGVYFHLCCNLSGYYYSACGRDLSWQPDGMRVNSCQVEAKYWQQQFWIPYSALRTACPQAGEVWQVNFARNDQGAAPAISSWSGSNDFHDLAKMGRLHFGQKAPQPQAVIAELRVLPAYLSGTFYLPPGLPADIRLELLCDGQTLCGSKTLAPQSREVMVYRDLLAREFLPIKDYGSIGCRIFSPSTGQIYLEQHARWPSDLQHTVLLDKYYYVPEDGHINFTLRNEEVFGHLEPENVQVSIHRDCQADTPVLQQWKGSGNGRLSLDGLPYGSLYLRVQWTVGERQYRTVRALQYHPQPLTAPPLPEHARLESKDGTLLLEKQPVFLFAGTATGKTFLTSGSCFNTNYAQYGLQENHIRAVPLMGSRFLRKQEQNWVGYTWLPWDELVPLWRKQFSEWDASQASFCRIAYESQMKVGIRGADGQLRDEVPAEWYRKVYREVKGIAPEVLLALHSDSPRFIPDAVPSCDIFETAFWSSSYAPDMLPKLDEDLAQAAVWCPDKPILFWLGGSIPNGRCRTAEELRTGLFMLIGRGMAGAVIHLGHGGLPPGRSRLWSLLSQVNAEVQEVFSQYQQGGAQVTAGDYVQAPPPVAVYARRQGRTVLLLACNRSGYEQQLTFLEGAAVTCLSAENKELTSRQDVLSPLEGKLFRLALP